MLSASRSAWLATGLMICVGTSPDASLAEWDKSYSVQGHHWVAQINPKERAVIKNDLGDVRIRTSPMGQIEVTALIQKLSPDQPDAVIQEIKQPEGYRIEATHPGDQNYNGRVDIGLVVPTEAQISVSTTDGTIEAKGHRGTVDASTKNGRVLLQTSGPISAATEGGEVIVVASAWRHTAPSSIETKTGNITVRFLTSQEIMVSAKTRGQIILDLPPGHEPVIEQAEGATTFSFGDASSELRIRSSSGTVTIQVDAEAPALANAPPKIVGRDLRTLPQAPKWQPGDPIVEVPKSTNR